MPSINEEKVVLRAARGKFMAMAASYFMGTFNDNFFKQAVMLLAVASLKPQFQGYVVMAFSLPFMLFAAPAGWVADTFSKRHVVIGAKVVELLGAVVGAIGILTGHLWVMVGMVALMGTQAAFFSPALNGSIPELYPPDHVTQANAWLRMIVTAGILMGITLSGFVLNLAGPSWFGTTYGKAWVAICVVAIGLVGLLVSLGIPKRAAADPGRPFPWTGPLETLKEIGRIWQDYQLGRILVLDVLVWTIGVLQVQIINPLGLNQLRIGPGGASRLAASQLLGLALGGLLSARFAKGDRWHRVLFPACAFMALVMMAIGLVPQLSPAMQTYGAFILVGLAGAAGGMLLIPCESFLQVRPPMARKGAVWASANFASFAGMAAAGALYLPFKNMLPTKVYAILGLACALLACWLKITLSKPGWQSTASE